MAGARDVLLFCLVHKAVETKSQLQHICTDALYVERAHGDTFTSLWVLLREGGGGRGEFSHNHHLAAIAKLVASVHSRSRI